MLLSFYWEVVNVIQCASKLRNILGEIYYGVFLGESVRDIFTMHDCDNFLSIFRENKIVVC